VRHLIAGDPRAEVRWVVFTGSPQRHAEARASAAALLAPAAQAEIQLHAFRESYLPQQWGGVKEEMQRIKVDFDPTLILTHRKEDHHQDHRLVAELTWNAFRDHLVLEYEIPKYEGDLGNPNLFVPVTREAAERKVDGLLRHFTSQKSRVWFEEASFLALMRLRGMGCNAPSGYAEAFHVRKLVM
jgi:LmbE family N-acetylglucosaminyl deacetylase